MASARVELRGALSHSRNGRTFRKGFAQTVTDPGEIAYYKSAGSFAVTMLEEEQKREKVNASNASPAPEDDKPAKEKVTTAPPAKGSTLLSGKTSRNK